MGARWEHPEPVPHVLDDAATWLLVLFLVLFLAPLVLGLS